MRYIYYTEHIFYHSLRQPTEEQLKDINLSIVRINGGKIEEWLTLDNCWCDMEEKL